MKIILLILIFISNLYSNYIIKYNDIDIGIIETLETTKNGYLEAKVTNNLIKFLIGTDKAILFSENFDLKDKEDYFQKKDKNKLLNVLNEMLYNIKHNEEENDNKIKYTKKDNIYNWIYTNSKGDEKKGYLIVNSQNELIEFNSFYKNVKILKI